MNKVCFLDRDGVLNEDTGYVFDWSKTELLIQNITVIAPLEARGYKFCIITNQSGIGRRYFSLSQYNSFMHELRIRLCDLNLIIDTEYFCPHVRSDNCVCRKPQNGMFERAFSENQYLRHNSIMIGDRESDLQAAGKSKVQHRFLLSESGVKYKDLNDNVTYFDNLTSAFDSI